MSNQNNNSNDADKNAVKTESNGVILYSFSEEGQGNWRVEDDVVMGGRSESKLKMTSENHAHFSGRISLENNGGFCSIHQTADNNPYEIADKAVAFELFLKGDGKNYNFRVRTPNGRHSYASTFSTKGNDEWEKITIPFNEMEATFHGEPVDVPNYAGETVVEMQLLIGNNKEESFEIFLESIAAI